MSQENSNQQPSADAQNLNYDSDNHFERPKDDYIFYHKAFKPEERKVINHPKFEQVVTKYWQLLRQMPQQDIAKPTISQEQYIELIKRIYKVCLPLYREQEVHSEILQEWLLDARGNSTEMTINVLAKVLFRIAHWWATHIDIEEYVDLLNRIYERITCIQHYKANCVAGNFTTIQPQIVVTFPEDEKKLIESGGKLERTTQDVEWMECKSDEENASDYEYKYEEDPEQMVVKKYKKPKSDQEKGAAEGEDFGSAQVIKEPFVYQEEVQYPGVHARAGESIVYTMLPLEDVLPFGYVTEQFLCWLKNDVHKRISESRNANKQQHYLVRNEFHGTDLTKEKDTGLLEERGFNQEFKVDVLVLANPPDCKVTISDHLYNSFRKLLKDGQMLSLRLYSAYPKQNARNRNRQTGFNNQEPHFEFNKFGYNPTLERRVHYKLCPIFSKKNELHYININYMIVHPDFETAYRCDIQKIETKPKLSIRDDNLEMRREEEYSCVEASYKVMRQVMLEKKFESIYYERTQSDTKEQKRLQKIIEKEMKRKENALKMGTLVQKSVAETYEEKSFIKMVRGPFYQFDSKEGLKEDDFYSCAEQDLIDAARQRALRILVIGKPRAGKTTAAQKLAAKLDLVHINVDNWINALLTKIKNYEPPEDLEEGQEPPKYLTDLEEQVNQALLAGSGPTDAMMVAILREQIHSPLAVVKGYVLDLHYYKREFSWANTIRTQRLLGQEIDGRAIEFSHIVEILVDDDDVKLRASNMRANPDDGKVYSRWEREERKKPKVLAEDEEPAEEDEDEANKPFDEFALIQRCEDMDERIREELHHYNTLERPSMEELLINFFDNQYVKIDAGGLTPDELTECIVCRIKADEDTPLRPLAIKIEGGAGDFKSLLTEGLEEGQIARKWSLWKQIDPVLLREGKVVQGSPEFACHYHGNVFVFATEENMNSFVNEPKKFLAQPPQMPEIFRVLMLGQTATGKHTQALKLNELYGWRIIDFKELVKNRLVELMQMETHIPNNPVEGGRIGLSETELSDIVEGKPFPAWKFIPWVLDHLGHPLMKKKPPPPEEKPEGEEEVEEIDEETKKKRDAEARKKAIEEEKKRKEEEEIQKYKEDRRRRRQEAIDAGLDPVEQGIEESEEEPVIIDDLSIDELVLAEDENGKTPFVGGFILIGFPETEEHIAKLKEHGIDFDKIIYLTDTNEEDPGTEIKARLPAETEIDWEFEGENAGRILGLVKEQYGDEIVREISCNGPIEDVLIRIRKEIDPFYMKVDDPDNVRVTADLDEEERRLPKGDFGDYCPVTYVRDNWLFKAGSTNEVIINGKTYWFAGEKEAEEFKFDPHKFLVTMRHDAYGRPRQQEPIPLQPPAPKIMVMGHRGAGTTTQIRMLCEKYKLEEFMLQDEYMKKLHDEKEQRKRRRLLDRGFRPPQPAEEEGMEPPPDPEIEEDPDTFDKEQHERDVMKLIYGTDSRTRGLVIDGSWRNLPEGAVNQNLQDLLVESRRVPEIVIILKCKEDTTFKRLIDFDGIKAEYERLMEIRALERKRVREEEREAFVKGLREANDAIEEEEEKKPEEEIEEEIAKWDEDRDAEEEAFDENDPDKPNLEEMLEKAKESLREQRTNDEAFFEEFATALRDKLVFVIDDIKADTSSEFVFVKILDRIKDHFQYRRDLIEKQLAQTLKPEEVKFYESSYNYKQSKYGLNSPLLMSQPGKTKGHAVLYRERLYYLGNENQQQQFIKEPSKYTQSVETVPLDISIVPKISIIGLPKSGKSTLCKRLAQVVGVVHLQVSKIIQGFMNQDSIQGEQLRKLMKEQGRQIEDELLCQLILKRIQFKDCQTKGFILEDFPKTKDQAIFLARKGLVPTNVILMRQTVGETYKRTEDLAKEKFGHNRVVLASRIKFYEKNTPEMLALYSRLYNNVLEIDSQRSKWFIEDQAMSYVSRNLAARQNFARDYFLRDTEQRACKLKDMHIDRTLTRQSLSEFGYYCPVSWRNEKLLYKCNENTEDCVLYRNAFYFFRSERERDMFVANPQRFLVNAQMVTNEDLPIRMKPHKAAEIVQHDKSLQAHCPITLMDEERVQKGDQILLALYKENRYVFTSEFKLQRFMAQPMKYARAALPVKMPPQDDKVSLYQLQKMEDSIAFMEQALGSIVTKALREVSDNRLKYPTISVKETMLKLFALYLKTENPANTENMKRKYAAKMKQFIQRCELPEEIYDLAIEKEKKKSKDGGVQWPEFKENFLNERGADYDRIINVIMQERHENFVSYIR